MPLSTLNEADEKNGAPTVKYGDDVKKVYLYQNGSPEIPPKRVVITKRQSSNWKKMLDQISEDVLPTRGYIRGLRTPVGGTIVRNYRDLKDSQAYVAVCAWQTFEPVTARKDNVKDGSLLPFKTGNPSSKYKVSRHIPSSNVTKPYL